MKGKDVYWEILPPFFMSKLLGMAPVDERFVLDKVHLAWTLGILVLTTSLGVYLGLILESANNMFRMSPFSLILERAQIIIVVLAVALSAIKSLTNVKTLYRVMRHLADLDLKLDEIGVLVPHSRISGYLLTILRFVLVVSLCLPDLIVFKSFRSINSIIIQYLLIVPLLVGNIVQLQFVVLLEIVQKRIRIIIEKVKDIGKGHNFVITNHLHVLVSVHSSLVSICEIVNSLYSPQILVILASVFINTVANLYHIIEKLMLYITLKKGDDINFSGMTTHRVFVRSLEVWMMVTACVKTQVLVKAFNVNLYQVMIDDKANELAGNSKLRLHVAMNRELVFTACGFFTLDYTLVHSMIAATTTYLVILVQFGDPNSASGDAANLNSTDASKS